MLDSLIVPAAILGKATAEAIMGNQESAVELIEEALSIEDNRASLYHRAAVVASRFDMASAAGYLAKARAIDPNYLQSQVWLGFVFTGLGDPETAAYWLDEAERADPYDTVYLWNRAGLLMAAGDRTGHAVLVSMWSEREPDSAIARRTTPGIRLLGCGGRLAGRGY